MILPFKVASLRILVNLSTVDVLLVPELGGVSSLLAGGQLEVPDVTHVGLHLHKRGANNEEVVLLFSFPCMTVTVPSSVLKTSAASVRMFGARYQVKHLEGKL